MCLAERKVAVNMCTSCGISINGRSFAFSQIELNAFVKCCAQAIKQLIVLEKVS